MTDMCTGSSNNYANAAQAQGYAQAKAEKPEITLAGFFRRDLGVDIDPQALRMFIRWRFDCLSPLAHKIHRGD